MPDLITRERALRNLANLASPSAAELQAIDTMIRTASGAIENHCRRAFVAGQYDELYNGTQSPRLFLRNFPIISIERIAANPTTVLTVTNNSATNQRATLKITKEGLDLTRVASAVTTLNSLAFSTYTTLSALKAAIDALGNGWSSTIGAANLESLATADIRPIQGAMNAKDKPAEVRIHVDEASAYEIDEARGIIIRGSECGGLDASTWQGGVNDWRVIYTAGYETVPEDVQEACAQWTAVLFWASKRDPGLAHEAIVGAESRRPYGDLPPSILELLRPYRVYPILSRGG
ncbi:MAG: hypothetical protein HY040_01100 [Planctomycetes bacterium]|nr:hypothetical protein [Planctomycetota bacterium]